MPDHILSWSTANGGGNQNVPAWTDVLPYLEEVRNGGGVVTLDTIEDARTTYRSLQVRSEAGNYLLTLGEETDDDWEVRTYHNPNSKESRVELLGDYWDAKMIFRNFEVVVAAFKEFYELGNVSVALLS
ncbi:hypothetical protein [Niveibacterium sp. COAC-50]|uniref:DUF6911 family protein n=1 Tax=Niveibacterium sp. COAC-50 TaxID=2729384 RepID=UPI001556E5DA|nr:hypothetical protein [Niveibacterium sp. COAC-50]